MVTLTRVSTLKSQILFECSSNQLTKSDVKNNLLFLFKLFVPISLLAMRKMHITNSIVITFLLLHFTGFGLVQTQHYFNNERDENILIWCTVNVEEQKKCESITDYLMTSNLPFPGYVNSPGHNTFQLQCTEASTKDECMVMIDNNMADVTTLDAGEVFVGGRYHSLVPILTELYRVEGVAGMSNRIYAVAVLRRSLKLDSLHDLRGKKACFAGVGTLAGWVIPISKLMADGGMEVIDCNNHVKSTMGYFGPSCAVNSLSDKYNPLGDNSHKLCEICGSDAPGVKCTSNDPYAGYQGALSCLFDQGEIAFVKHSSVLDYFNIPTQYDTGYSRNFTGPANENSQNNLFPFPGSTTSNSQFIPQSQQNQTNFPFGVSNGFGRDRNYITDGLSSAVVPELRMTLSDFKVSYDLLCPDAKRKNIEDWRSCHWGEIPSHVVVTSSAKSSELRLSYQNFIQNLAQWFGSRSGSGFQSSNIPQQQSPQQFGTFGQHAAPIKPLPRLFESFPHYGNRSNLLFSDATVSLRSIAEYDQTYKKYLGEESLKAILGTRACPVGKVTLCVTSDAEMTKCIKMKTALNAQILKPEMSCHRGHSHINCMESIRNGDADVAVFDAGDVYKGGLNYELIPVLAEVYNLGEPEYYAVAVAYQGDADTELTYLKGKRSCHSGIGHAAGWVVPMSYLLSSGRMRSYGCDSLTAAAQYFTKSCVPGALSNEYNFGREHSNLCDLCHGSSYSYCSRDASEDFYGYTGALRCLVEGGGQVAFVKHTTVSEVADGKRRETWARNLLSGDYELLCRDGTRSSVNAFERCNLGKVKANAVVIRGGAYYNETEANAIINLFLYAQQFYGRKLEDDFNFGMFYSPAPYSDLIFQDAAQQLQVIPPSQRHYHHYLGKTFIRNMALVDCRAGVSRTQMNLTLLSLSFLYYCFYTLF